MPTIRIGYGSDFSIDSNGVGIGTTFAAANTKLDVVGALKGDFNITGVTTLTAYGGFVAQNQHINKPSTIGFATVGLQTFAGLGTVSQYYETDTGFTDLGGVHHGDDQYFNTLSEDLVIDDGQILNITNTDMVGFTTIGEYDPHNHSSYVCEGSLEQVSVTGHFSVPNGGINDRQLTPIEGTVRFNNDLNTLEFFNGNEWRQFNYNQGQSGRALIAGGNTGSVVSMIQSYNITTLGDTINFGDRTVSGGGVAGFSNGTRAVFGGGTNPTFLNVIDYVSIASAGTAADFGDFLSGTLIAYRAAASSSTRGIFSNGWVNGSSNTNAIEYVQISTTGNGVDFGDTSTDSGTGRRSCMALSSPTRYVVAGGYSSTYLNEMDYITISSLGNSLSFGDLTLHAFGAEGVSNTIVGAFGGGRSTPGAFNSTIDYLQISTTGSTSQFGDLIEITTQSAGSCTNTRGVFAGGYNPGNVEIMSYISLDSKGDSIDFGNLSLPVHKAAGTSDSHGGLGGF